MDEDAGNLSTDHQRPGDAGLPKDTLNRDTDEARPTAGRDKLDPDTAARRGAPRMGDDGSLAVTGE